jgi:hypothetical protein
MHSEEHVTMSRRFTAIRLSGGTSHQHIIRLWWVDPASTQSDNDSRADLVSWIERGGSAYVEDSLDNRVSVGVVVPQVGEKYLRTHADGKWTDNLLALPQQ